MADNIKLDQAVLVGGPQDGGKVCNSAGLLPAIVYVGRRPKGDGYAAWSDEPSVRFPTKYVCVRGIYRFSGYEPPKEKPDETGR